MKLDRPGSPHTAPLAPEEWSMDIDRKGSMVAADIKRLNEHMCRVSITANGYSEAEQRTALAEKARLWIAEYVRRREAGESDFPGLT